MKRSLKIIVLLSALLVAFIAVRVLGLGEYIDAGRLVSSVQSVGPLAPGLFILIYAVAPSLLFPGLPLTVAAGILFGPFWGTVYVIFGATIGATVAFLIARHMGREWVEERLSGAGEGSKLRELDRRVESEGWKVVAVTRLIPLFPYNLLNYAFGLTGIRLVHYALASFVFMLPGTIAYVVFGSSLLDIIKGQVSLKFIIGVLLVVAVSLIPLFYRRFSSKG